MEAVAAAWTFLKTHSAVIGLGSAALSGISAIRSGQEQAASLRFQGQMALLQGQERSLAYKREELNARKQASEVLERLARANSAARARAAAMNISPLSGSPLDLQAYNDTQAGNEWETAIDNADTMSGAAKRAEAAGAAQHREYKSSAKSAASSGLLKGLFSIGAGAMSYASLGGPPSAAQSAGYGGTWTSQGPLDLKTYTGRLWD